MSELWCAFPLTSKHYLFILRADEMRQQPLTDSKEEKMKITSRKGTEVDVQFTEISQYGDRKFSLSVPSAGLEVKKAKLWPKAQIPFLEFSQKGKRGKVELQSEDLETLMSLSNAAFLQYEREKKEEENRKYAPLEAKLPRVPVSGAFESGQKETIMAEIAKIEKRAARFTDSEDEGIYMGIRREIGRLQSSCPHEWDHTLSRGHTHDARCEVKRDSVCHVCGKRSIQKVSEELSQEAF